MEVEQWRVCGWSGEIDSRKFSDNKCQFYDALIDSEKWSSLERIVFDECVCDDPDWEKTFNSEEDAINCLRSYHVDIYGLTHTFKSIGGHYYHSVDAFSLEHFYIDSETEEEISHKSSFQMSLGGCVMKRDCIHAVFRHNNYTYDFDELDEDGIENGDQIFIAKLVSKDDPTGVPYVEPEILKIFDFGEDENFDELSEKVKDAIREAMAEE